jgi:uncharacterized membrane protein YqaE (UPF0057 family)
MKYSIILGFSILASLLLGACASSNEVAGNGLIQKRKYNKGWYLNRQHSDKSTVKKDQNREENDLAKAEDQNLRTQNSHITDTRIVESNEVTLMQDAYQIPASEDEIFDNSSAIKEVESKGVSHNEKNPVNQEENENENKVAEVNENDLNIDSNSSVAQTDSMFILAVIFAIIIPPIGVLIYTNIDWMKVLICLLLTFLFILPGMIYALLVVFDVL